MSILTEGKKLPTNDDWLLLVVCGVHNHPTANHLKSHSYVGRLLNEGSSFLKNMSKSNVRPKDILSAMKQRDAFNTTAIYNAQAKQKREEKAGRSQMQHLLG